MKNKILIMLLVTSLIAYPTAAFDQTTYGETTINYVITTNTLFSYTQTIPNPMTFNAKKNDQMVAPEGTGGGANAWGTITNSGDENTFIARLDQNNPTGFVLLISHNQNMSENIAVSTSPQSPPHWTNVPNGGIVNLYARANFNNAPNGNVVRTLKVGVPPEVKSISVTPKTASIYEPNDIGVTDTQQFTAAILDQYDMAFSVPVAWTNQNSSIGSINSAGLYTSKAVGLDTITATAGGKTDTATVSVAVAPTI